MPTYDCHLRAWRQHRDELKRFLAHRSGNAAEADDLLQEVFLRVVAQEGAFCRVEHPRAWLFHVARNLLLDRLRMTKAHVPLPDDLVAEPSSEVDPVERLSQCLPRVLAELAVEDRTAIVTCDLEGASQKDYAARSGLTLAAAKSRLLRARQRLRARLAEACQLKYGEDGKICCFTPRAPSAGEPEPSA